METENKQETEVLSFEKQKKVELEDKTYRLEEMSEAMKQSIANAKKVREEQDELVNIVLESSKASKFRDFTKNMEQQIENINKQTETLSVRSALLDNVVKACKDDDKVAEIVTMLVTALGVFEQ